MSNPLENIIKNNLLKFPKARIGYYAINNKTGKKVGLNEYKIFGTASIIKLAIGLRLFDLFEKSKLDIDKSIKIDNYLDVKDVAEFKNGVLAYFPNNESITLRLASLFMLNLSDNSATNLVLRFVNKKSINQYLRSLGFKKTKLNFPAISPIYQKRHGYNLGLTTPKEIAELIDGIVLNRFLNNHSNSENLTNMLLASYPESTFNRNLPITWNVPKNEVRVKKIFNKTGAFPPTELRSNVLTILTDKDEFITISILTQGIKNSNDLYPSNLNPDHPSTIFIGKIVRLIFDYLY